MSRTHLGGDLCFKRRVEGFLIAALVNLSLQSVRQRRASRALLTVSVLPFSSTHLPMLRFGCTQARQCGVIVYESTLLSPRFYFVLCIPSLLLHFCTAICIIPQNNNNFMIIYFF